jgi:peptidase M48-like protein
VLARIGAVALLLVSSQAWAGEREDHGAFVARHGGLVGGAAAERAGAVAHLLFAAPGLAHLRLDVVAEREVGAWAWPSGELMVSQGLVDAADDDELIAAIAHEVGHLLGGGSPDGVQGLAGPALSGDVEIRADALGCRLLRAQALPTGGMRRVLLRLVASARDASEARAYGERLRHLDPACASEP